VRRLECGGHAAALPTAYQSGGMAAALQIYRYSHTRSSDTSCWASIGLVM